MYHPVTTEYEVVGNHIQAVVDALIQSDQNYIVIYPNNDLGTEVILNEYKRFEGRTNFRVFPSIRFEYFLTLLKNADFMIGNSSAGIRETGIYGIPSIDIGTRQKNRYNPAILKNIQSVPEDTEAILHAIAHTDSHRFQGGGFGLGNSTEAFMHILNSTDLWSKNLQKHFVDLGEL